MEPPSTDDAAGGAAPGQQSGTGRLPPVKLWFCADDELTPSLAGALAAHWLDEYERDVAGRFVFERDRRQYLVAHALLRRVLCLEVGLPEGELTIRRSSRGRPFLRRPPGGLPRGRHRLDFSLAHAGGYSLLGVVRRHRIGVDVESLDRGGRSIQTVARTFTAEEQAWVAAEAPGRRRDHRVLRLWTLKEAYTKARGLGLSLAFDSFSFTLAAHGVTGFRPPADDSAGRWQFMELEPVPDVLVAVAVRTGATAEPLVELHMGFPWDRAAPRLVALPRPPGTPAAAGPDGFR